MIGNDCKLIEMNITKFLVYFIKKDKNEEWECKSFEKMRQVATLYNLFADLAQDIRSITANKVRAASFSKRANVFFNKLKNWAGGNSVHGKPYLHILREHIGDIMVLWEELMDWGYGYFSCTAGEHLNKIIKTMEVEHTNPSANRFETIVRNLRVKQFHFPSSTLPAKQEIKCSSCNQSGHTKKNKSCPMHPTQPDIVFEESDTEN